MTAIFVLVGLDVFGMATTSLAGPYASAENQNLRKKAYPIPVVVQGGVLDGGQLMEIRRSC
jgi:hypothetical protein